MTPQEAQEAIEVLKAIASFDNTIDYILEHSVSVQDACYTAIKALENIVAVKGIEVKE